MYHELLGISWRLGPWKGGARSHEVTFLKVRSRSPILKFARSDKISPRFARSIPIRGRGHSANIFEATRKNTFKSARPGQISSQTFESSPIPLKRECVWNDSGGFWFSLESCNISLESLWCDPFLHQERESKWDLRGRSSDDPKSHRERFCSSAKSSGQKTERECLIPFWIYTRFVTDSYLA